MELKSKRKIIGVDCDDVLGAHAEAFIEFSNSRYSTALGPNDYCEHWEKIWEVETEEISRRAEEFHQPESVMAFKVKAGSQDAIKRLGEYHDLFVVTARRHWLVETTYQWIEAHFPGTFKGIHLVPVWEPDNTITKADICKSVGADYLIDDLPRHCNLVAEAGIGAVLFGNYPWVQGEEVHPNVVSCHTWNEVLAYFGVPTQ